MAPQGRVSTVRRFLLFVVLLDLVLLAIVGAICWFGGWRSALDYAHGLTYAGLIIFACGGMQYVGSFTRTIDPIAGYRSTPSGERLAWMQRAMGEQDSSFANMLKLGLAGVILVILGQVLLGLIS
jgi:hypothetical protein